MQKVNKSLIWIMVAIMVFVGALSLLIFAVGMQELEKTQIAVGDGEVITENETCDMPSELVFLSSAESKSITLTATVSPAEATNKNIDWTVSWNTSDEAFLRDHAVADFIGISQIDSTSAKVTYLKPFEKQIMITARSSENSRVNAVCKVDCMQYIKSAVATIVTEVRPMGSSGTDSPVFTDTIVLDSRQSAPIVLPYHRDAQLLAVHKTTVTYEFTYSVGTVKDTYVNQVYCFGDPAYLNVAQSAGLNGWERKQFVIGGTGESGLDFACDPETLISIFGVSPIDDLSLTARKIRSALCSLETHVNFTIYAKGAHDSFYSNVSATFDKEQLKVPVESVTLNQTEYVFAG